MASITLCPRCSSHLELPAGLTPTSLVECPICEAEFLLASVAPRAIPKVRLVEQDIHHPAEQGDDEELKDAAARSSSSPATLGIIVDDDLDAAGEATPAAESTDDKLSRLLRSTSSWQLPGAAAAEDVEEAAADDADESAAEVASFEEFDAEIDDRIIPNDHAPRPTFGATLDAAYRDADPEAATPAAPAADELKLGGSRLDQLLSDLMKTPPAPLTPATPMSTEVDVSPSLAASPTFAEFESDEQTAAELEPASDAEVAETELAEYDAVEEEPGSVDATGNDESFEDRWRRLQAIGAAAEAGATAEEDATSEEYADADEEDDVTYEASAEAEDEPQQWTSDEEFDELERSTPIRRKRPSVVKTLVGVVGGGFIGIFLAGYALLWLKGPDGDLLGIANLLPAAMLPGDAASAALEPLSLAEDRLPAPAPVDATPLPEAAPAEQPAESSLNFADEPPSPVGDGIAATEMPPADATTPAAPFDSPMHRDTNVLPTAAVEPIADATQWPTTPIIGALRGVPLFSLDDLSSHIASADAAHRTFLAGDLARKEDVAAMGQAYIELCKLAERFTLTDPQAFGNDLVTKQMAAKLIFRGAVGDPARRNDLAMIAGRWLEHARRPNQGVLLLGRVTDLQPQGKWTEYTIETPLGSTVSVNKVLMDKIDFKFGDEVAVVGAIVANPSQTIADYTGDAKQVVVSGFAFAPEDFVAPQTGATADLFTP